MITSHTGTPDARRALFLHMYTLVDFSVLFILF